MGSGMYLFSVWQGENQYRDSYGAGGQVQRVGSARQRSRY